MHAIFPSNSVLELCFKAEFANGFDLALIYHSLPIKLTLIFSKFESQQLLYVTAQQVFYNVLSSESPSAFVSVLHPVRHLITIS